MASSLSSLKTQSISLTILSTILFFLLKPPSPNHPQTPLPRRSLLTTTTTCSSISQIHGLINYPSLHFCLFNQNPLLSVPFLSLTVLFHFYILVKTAQDRFSTVVTRLSTHLNLSPSMGAVTLLALGNGAPDVFASVAAVRGGHARTGFSAILSAGAFVSALVVGFVAIYAGPFGVDPASFVRDVLFYLTAVLFMFYVYLSGEIFLWQAVGFVGFYLFFVGFVFWIDLGVGSKGRGRGGSEVGGGCVVVDVEEERGLGLEKQGDGEIMGCTTEGGGAKRGVRYRPFIYQACKYCLGEGDVFIGMGSHRKAKGGTDMGCDVMAVEDLKALIVEIMKMDNLWPGVYSIDH